MTTLVGTTLDVSQYDTVRFGMDVEVSNDGVTWTLVKAYDDAPPCRWARLPVRPGGDPPSQK